MQCSVETGGGKDYQSNPSPIINTSKTPKPTVPIGSYFNSFETVEGVAQPTKTKRAKIMSKRFMSTPFMFTKTVHPGAMFVKK